MKNSKQKIQKINNKVIYNNYNTSLKSSPITRIRDDIGRKTVLDSTQLYITRQNDRKEVFHHPKNRADYGQDVKNKITSLIAALYLGNDNSNIASYNEEIIDNDNKITHRIISKFGAMHDIKCAFLCCFLEVSVVFILANFINAKGEFNSKELWNDIKSQFIERPKESWIIFAVALLIFIITAVVIPIIVKNTICKPYLNRSAILIETNFSLSANIDNFDNRDITELYRTTIGINSEENEIRNTFLLSAKSILQNLTITTMNKIKLLDSFMWTGSFVHPETKELIKNPYFEKYNIQIKHNSVFRLSRTPTPRESDVENKSVTTT